MLHPAATLEAHAACAAVGRSHTAWCQHQAVQLAAMQPERHEIHDLRIVGLEMSSRVKVGEHPAIDTMRVKTVGQLLLGFLESKLIADRLGIVTWACTQRCNLD